MQFKAWNFKPKGANEVICDYFFKPVGLYRIADIQMAQLLIPKKREK